MEGRAQFFTLQTDSAAIFTIINVYAPTESLARVQLWHQLVDANIPGERFILGGDFNMVEAETNRLGGSQKCTTSNRREKAVWVRLLNHFGLVDAWSSNHIRKTSDHRFSWNNNRAGPKHRGVRIDRIYASSAMCEQGGDFTIHPLAKISDHAPVQLRIDT